MEITTERKTTRRAVTRKRIFSSKSRGDLGGSATGCSTRFSRLNCAASSRRFLLESANREPCKRNRRCSHPFVPSGCLRDQFETPKTYPLFSLFREDSTHPSSDIASDMHCPIVTYSYLFPPFHQPCCLSLSLSLSLSGRNILHNIENESPTQCLHASHTWSVSQMYFDYISISVRGDTYEWPRS